jgi:hypothetical protein
MCVFVAGKLFCLISSLEIGHIIGHDVSALPQFYEPIPDPILVYNMCKNTVHSDIITK